MGLPQKLQARMVYQPMHPLKGKANMLKKAKYVKMRSPLCTKEYFLRFGGYSRTPALDACVVHVEDH